MVADYQVSRNQAGMNTSPATAAPPAPAISSTRETPELAVAYEDVGVRHFEQCP
jgi:hypothetical protein